MNEISAPDPLCGPYEDDLERVRRRRADQSIDRPMALPSAEELLALAEERRDAIRASLQQGQQGVSVRDNQTFARFFRGEMPNRFPLPNLERLWNAAYILELPGVPPWSGEPVDSPSALERLGVLIGWLQGQRSELNKPAEQSLETALRDYLAANPGASIRRVAEVVGASIGAVQKTNAWQKEMERRDKETPAIRQTSFPSLDRAGIVDAEEQLRDHREPDPADAAIAAEEATDEAIWQRLIDAAKPNERATLHAASPEIQRELIKAVREGRSNADLQKIVAMLASQQADAQSDERRGKRRRRSDKQA